MRPNVSGDDRIIVNAEANDECESSNFLGDDHMSVILNLFFVAAHILRFQNLAAHKEKALRKMDYDNDFKCAK